MGRKSAPIQWRTTMFDPNVVRRPVRFARQSLPEHRNVPFVDSHGVLQMDRKDKVVAVGIVFAVVVMLGLDFAWFMGWL